MSSSVSSCVMPAISLMNDFRTEGSGIFGLVAAAVLRLHCQFIFTIESKRKFLPVACEPVVQTALEKGKLSVNLPLICLDARTAVAYFKDYLTGFRPRAFVHRNYFRGRIVLTDCKRSQFTRLSLYPSVLVSTAQIGRASHVRKIILIFFFCIIFHKFYFQRT